LVDHRTPRAALMAIERGGDVDRVQVRVVEDLRDEIGRRRVIGIEHHEPVALHALGERVAREPVQRDACFVVVHDLAHERIRDVLCVVLNELPPRPGERLERRGEAAEIADGAEDLLGEPHGITSAATSIAAMGFTVLLSIVTRPLSSASVAPTRSAAAARVGPPAAICRNALSPTTVSRLMTSSMFPSARASTSAGVSVYACS